MKITLTKVEAMKIVTAHFREMFPNDVVEICLGENTVALNEKDRGVISEISKLDFMGGQKIAAIKILRAAVPGMGLYEAKCAVEDFTNYTRDCELVGRLLTSWKPKA